MAGRSETPESDEDHEDGFRNPDSTQHRRKRQRIRLSCLECRRRKLSCDRGFPCERCTKSGTSARCSYESRDGEVVKASSSLSSHLSPLDARRRSGGGGSSLVGTNVSREHDSVRPDLDRIRKLELEISQLKQHLSKSNAGGASYDGSTVAATVSPATQKGDVSQDVEPDHPQDDVQEYVTAMNLSGDKEELRFFRGKGFRTRYFGPHNASMAFVELTGLCPFMKETAEEWLRPVIVHERKDRQRRMEERQIIFDQRDLELEALLPDKHEADALIEVYLNQFEQVHRIVHIPTFRKEYQEYWEPNSKTRHAAFTVLLLSIMAVTSCVHAHQSLKFIGMMSDSRHWAEKWIRSCDEWLGKQSQKHRKLIHFQVSCLLYLGKRVNTIKKKRFWTGAGALIQDGIAVGLHREPSHMSGKISVYDQEMRRRIWATVVEFDMQASFDHGLPTMVSHLHHDTNPPRNLDDEDFGPDTTTLPPSKADDRYSFSSFQNLARRSLPLRLELSRMLTGPLHDIGYEQIIRYTDDLTQEIDALPSWDMNKDNVKGKKNPLLAYTLLHVQLRQYIIPLHQPYLKLRKENSKYQYSEIMYYNAARDIVLLHDKLYEQGIRALNFLREDALTTAINLCSVTLLQPRGSTNMIMINSHHTVKLIEKCIVMKEDRLLRCGNNEPWGYSMMCAALGLLEAHLGTKEPEVAKSTSAERFVNLQYRLLANQEPPRALAAVSSESRLTSGTTGTDGSISSSELTNYHGTQGLMPDVQPSNEGTKAMENGGYRSGTMMPPSLSSSKPMTPMTFTASMASAEMDPVNAQLFMPGPVDHLQLYNIDPSLELLGLNLNELWGDGWELG